MRNTIDYTKKLEATGFSREQSEACLEILFEVSVKDRATKDDLLQLEERMNFRINGLRSDMDLEFARFRAEMAEEFAKVRTEMATEFANVRAEMATEFQQIRKEISQTANRNLAILIPAMALILSLFKFFG